MQIHKFETQEEWLAARLGKITGSRLNDIVVKRGTGQKIGYYELIAERLALPADGENPMDRGNRLEDEAIERFMKETGKVVDISLVLWTRDDNECIAVSPDGVIGEEESVEVKCLSSAQHIKAFFEHIPSEYQFQKLQYFIVNEKLETLYFVFYDPRLMYKDFFYVTVKREDVKEEIAEYLEYQKKILEAVNGIVTKLSF